MIEDFIGKPFIDGARGPDGYDCWGLVKAIYLKEYNTILPDYYISALDTKKVSCKMMAEKNKYWEKLEDLEDGLLVTISLDMAMPRNVVNHVGVYLGYNRFIHTRARVGSVIERTDDFKWANRIEGFYKYVG